MSSKKPRLTRSPPSAHWETRPTRTSPTKGRKTMRRKVTAKSMWEGWYMSDPVEEQDSQQPMDVNDIGSNTYILPTYPGGALPRRTGRDRRLRPRRSHRGRRRAPRRSPRGWHTCGPPPRSAPAMERACVSGRKGRGSRWRQTGTHITCVRAMQRCSRADRGTHLELAAAEGGGWDLDGVRDDRQLEHRSAAAEWDGNGCSAAVMMDTPRGVRWPPTDTACCQRWERKGESIDRHLIRNTVDTPDCTAVSPSGSQLRLQLRPIDRSRARARAGA